MTSQTMNLARIPGGWDAFGAEFDANDADFEAAPDDALDLAGFEEADAIPVQPPPPAVGNDERRMQVRVYNAWSELVRNGGLPSFAAFAARQRAAFDPHAVVLDLSGSSKDPLITHIGSSIANECECADVSAIRHLSDAPNRSLLSRIADHYGEIIQSRAPMGFEARFVNAAGNPAMCRGILLPFADRPHVVEQIYAVLNWKEFADRETLGAVTEAMVDAMRDAPPRRAAARADPLPEPLGKRLRAITPTQIDALSQEGDEFPVLLGRRLPDGEVVLLGEIAASQDLRRVAADSLLRQAQSDGTGVDGACP